MKLNVYFSEKISDNFNLPLHLVESLKVSRQRSYGLVSMPLRTQRLDFETHQLVYVKAFRKASLVLCIDVMPMKEQKNLFRIERRRTNEVEC